MTDKYKNLSNITMMLLKDLQILLAHPNKTIRQSALTIQNTLIRLDNDKRK